MAAGGKSSRARACRRRRARPSPALFPRPGCSSRRCCLLRRAAGQSEHFGDVGDVFGAELYVLVFRAQVVVLLRQSEAVLDEGDLLGRVLEVLLFTVSEEDVDANRCSSPISAEASPCLSTASICLNMGCTGARPFGLIASYPCTPCRRHRSSAGWETSRPPAGALLRMPLSACVLTLKAHKTGPPLAGRPESDGSWRTSAGKLVKVVAGVHPGIDRRRIEPWNRLIDLLRLFAVRRRLHLLRNSRVPCPRRDQAPLPPVPSRVRDCLTSLTFVPLIITSPLLIKVIQPLYHRAGPARHGALTICTHCPCSCVCETLPLRALVM